VRMRVAMEAIVIADVTDALHVRPPSFTDGGPYIDDGGSKITAAHKVKGKLASLVPSAPLTSRACP